jgi:protease-4
MKNFFASLFGTLVGLGLFAILLVALMVGGVALLVSVSKKKQVVMIQSNSYLTFDLGTSLSDKPPEVTPGILFEKLQGDSAPTATLRQVTEALKAASKDKRISGLYLHGGSAFEGSGGFAMRREMRASIDEFKKSGKRVVTYIMSPSLKDYYVASVADHILMNPAGEILIPGLGSERTYFARAFEKAGIGVQVTRVGKYKSAIEPLISDKRSPEDREQTQKLLDDLWSEFTGTVEKARKIETGSIQQITDTNPLVDAEAARQAKLVDEVAPFSSLVDELKKATGSKKSDESFRQISLETYASLIEQENAVESKNEGVIAVAYAEGTIVNGRGDRGEIGSEKLSRTLRQIRHDKSVKAIVLRVNSPGGSASASDEIVQELTLARKAGIPVVVSMGDVAASGGYWIATSSDQIVAQPNTITGSIGVFGVLPNIEKLGETLGLSWDTVSTGKLSNFFTLSRAKTPEELGLVQRMVDKTYQLFLEKVAASRKLKVEQVQEIAQGRVWSGREALHVGLVDQLGGLQEAINSAAALAKVSDFEVEEYPKSQEFLQNFLEKLQNAGEGASAPGLGTRLWSQVRSEYNFLNSFNDPRGVYAVMPYRLNIQ